MNDFDYDLIVIGAGSGGTRTARIAAGYGAKTAVIEGDRPGGTCVLRGCVPKKLLVYASQFSEQVSDAEGFGWQIDNFNSNWNDLIIKKNKELDRLHEIYVKLIKNSGCELITGWGKIIGPNTVSKVWIIENATSGSQNIIIKQGSVATVTIAADAVKVVYSDGGGSGAADYDALSDLNLGGTPTATNLRVT